MGPQRADLLKKELAIHTFNDLLWYFPFRHIDRTKVNRIHDIQPSMDYVQLSGQLLSKEVMGERQGKRLICQFKDESGSIELVWFQGINWIQKSLSVGQHYLVYGKLSFYQGRAQVTHPETEVLTAEKKQGHPHLEPVYPSTEKLKVRGLGGRQLGKLMQALFVLLRERDIPENLPATVIRQHHLMPRYDAFEKIHFPPDVETHRRASERIKFEELLVAQVRMGRIKTQRHQLSRSAAFGQVGELFQQFYHHHLPFALTAAQKKVFREIRKDCGSGRQMNRLLQGDVGSGKTIVALLAMLLAADNGYQSCLMAPTEILARQHYANISRLLEGLPVEIGLLTGSTRAADKKKTLAAVQEGQLLMLVGTHALIEETVQFSNLGLAIVDEQHRFGVAQRARLWTKSVLPPHILVMTATPIPRTLALSVYGDLDYSVMDELPPNRQPVLTVHRYDEVRSQVMDFIRTEIDRGRQAYILFPLIEESEKLDYENLMKGYENVKAYFPEPRYWISMVHGRQQIEQRETNMERFRNKDTQIMVATTVIEVGVDIPNASVMVIESAERFGLAQLHQLRGRVGRGSEKSFCILLTGRNLGAEARERMKIMCATNDGFRIAEKDLELRGPGEIEGTRQSGVLNFKLADIVQDRALLESANHLAKKILETDPELNSAENLPLHRYLKTLQGKTAWSRIS